MVNREKLRPSFLTCHARIAAASWLFTILVNTFMARSFSFKKKRARHLVRVSSSSCDSESACVSAVISSAASISCRTTIWFRHLCKYGLSVPARFFLPNETTKILRNFLCATNLVHKCKHFWSDPAFQCRRIRAVAELILVICAAAALQLCHARTSSMLSNLLNTFVKHLRASCCFSVVALALSNHVRNALCVIALVQRLLKRERASLEVTRVWVVASHAVKVRRRWFASKRRVKRSNFLIRRSSALWAWCHAFTTRRISLVFSARMNLFIVSSAWLFRARLEPTATLKRASKSSVTSCWRWTVAVSVLFLMVSDAIVVAWWSQVRFMATYWPWRLTRCP